MKQQKHLTEEQIIDVVLGNLSANEHVRNCTHCQEKLDNWSHIMSHEIDETPSDQTKEKIWQQLEKTRQPKLKRRTAFIYSFGAIAAILLIAIGIIFYQSSINRSYEVTFNDAIENQIQHEKETRHVSVIPVADFPEISGNLWINDDRNELLLEVDGLKSLSNNDYQLWIIDEKDKMKGEILSIQDGASRIFLKGDHIGSLRLLKGSLEPIGGSKEPTGPEMFIVPVNY